MYVHKVFQLLSWDTFLFFGYRSQSWLWRHVTHSIKNPNPRTFLKPKEYLNYKILAYFFLIKEGLIQNMHMENSVNIQNIIVISINRTKKLSFWDQEANM